MRRVVPFILAALALVPAAAGGQVQRLAGAARRAAALAAARASVYDHWIAYDEGRLYALLHITREQLWQQLRDDHRNIAPARRRATGGATRAGSRMR